MIVGVRVVLKRTVVGDWRFDYLSGNHLQSQVNSVCQSMIYNSGPLNVIGQLSHDGIGWNARVKFVISHKTEHKRATRNGDASNHIAVHHQLTNHNIEWDSAQCYFQRLTLERWYTNLEQTPLNRCQQLPVRYKRLLQNGNETDKRTSNRPT